MFKLRIVLSFTLLATFPLLGQEELPQRTFRTTVSEVVAPVTVLTARGSYVNGLEAKDFRLYDNEKLQDLRLSVAYNPISMVVAIERSSRVEGLLPDIKKIGNMLESMVVGKNGEVALLAFDHRLKWIQDFTNDGAKLSAALEKLTPGSSSSRMVDAVFEAINKLQHRPKDHRRILVLISETRDYSSSGKMRDALIEAEFNNVIIYSIDINRAVAGLTRTPPAPRPSPFPVASQSMPGPAPSTPQMAAQLRGDQSMTFVPIITEIFTQVKSIFIPNQAEVFTKYTGGREYSFTGRKSLERAIADLGEELHSQYILTYTPNDLEQGGYHTIRVEVNRPNLRVRTRPGYWMATKTSGN